VTGLVDDLEGVGLVERRPHPTDRRASLVTLTRKGKSTTEWMLSERRNAAEALFGDVDGKQLAAFITVMHDVLGKLERPDAD
jgi:DNA-binding MarR family transcriptional regulator